MDDLQAPAPAEMEPAVDAFEAESPEPQAEKPEPKPKSEGEKRRASLEKAFKAIEDDEDEKPANGSPSTPKPEDKADEKPKAEAKAKEPKADEKQPEKAEEQPKAKPVDPPTRFSPEAKEAWKDAPEAVKGEAIRAVKELERGLQQKDAELKPLEPFLKMAKQQNVKPHEVINRYVQMEQTLRENPRQGLVALAQNLGMTPQQMAGLLTTGQPGKADPRDQQVMALQRQIQQMQQQFGQVSQTVQEQRQNTVMQSVQQFASDKPRFDELAPEIARLIETGYASDLSDAYTKAERMNPAPAQPAQPVYAQPAQTRQARSVTGAPSAGSNPGTRKPSANRTEAIQRAMRATGLA